MCIYMYTIQNLFVPFFPSWQDLVAGGVVEYIDCLEEEDRNDRHDTRRPQPRRGDHHIVLPIPTVRYILP